MADEKQAFTSLGNMTMNLDDETTSETRVVETKSLEEVENMLSSAIQGSINAVQSMAQEYERELIQLQKDSLSQWKTCIQCLEKLTEAAVEARNELIERKDNQMKNIRVLASALNGLTQD